MSELWGHIGIRVPHTEFSFWYAITWAECSRLQSRLEDNDYSLHFVDTLSGFSLILNPTNLDGIMFIHDDEDMPSDDWKIVHREIVDEDEQPDQTVVHYSSGKSIEFRGDAADISSTCMTVDTLDKHYHDEHKLFVFRGYTYSAFYVPKTKVAMIVFPTIQVQEGDALNRVD